MSSCSLWLDLLTFWLQNNKFTIGCVYEFRLESMNLDWNPFRILSTFWLQNNKFTIGCVYEFKLESVPYSK